MRFNTQFIIAFFFCVAFVYLRSVKAQLSQSTINIAQGKEITASATCGYDLPPGEKQELFCKLSTVPGKFGRNGLECDYCNPRLRYGAAKDVKDHDIRYAIDSTERWWQSPPLSRGLEYNQINVTINLGQVYHVVYVVIKTANSPRPGTWILERSRDFGVTYTPWYYFAPSRSECLELFNINPLVPLQRDNQVLCESRYSEIPPFENGEMYISLVNGRPSALQYQLSPTLQDWMEATNVRLRLLATKTLLGEYLPLAKGDDTVTRRYFYSIKDLTIGGLCICNGYAEQCAFGPSRERTYCQCQNNTCGATCSECCSGYNQYKWKSGFERGEGCEACNCHGHSDKCEYREDIDAQNRSINIAGEYRGGGVCIDCKDNTAGINCEVCKPKYYNPTGVPITDKNACIPCNCNETFSTGACDNGDGQCQCKERFAGKKCDQCSLGFYDFPDCKPCQCNAIGTKDRLCQANGDQCPCKDNYAGPKCNRCAPGFYNFPLCIECECNEQGSYSGGCDISNGECSCFGNFQGRRCDQCADGHYAYPSCRRCSCDENGVTNAICDKRSGACFCKPGFSGPRCNVCAIGYFNYPFCTACQCSGDGSLYPNCDGDGNCRCKPQYAGKKCDRCALGYYAYPNCVPCTCDRRGSLSDYCDPDDGQCRCKENFAGRFCSICKSGYYGFPECQKCRCNPAGVQSLSGRPNGECINEGQCICKRFVVGRNCSKCKARTYRLEASNPYGCKECRCDVKGVLAGMQMCDQETGKCTCKEHVTSKRCEMCKDGYYALRRANAFGCSGCNCNVGGSSSPICDKLVGQCDCLPNVEGRKCDRPSPRHYHADLFQQFAEIEDGRTPDNKSVRFRYSEKEFEGYSWRGYGVFSSFQRSVIVRVNAKWRENYHMVFHYVLNGSENAHGEVIVRRVGSHHGVTQRGKVTFKPTKENGDASNRFVVVGEKGTSTQFAMLDGLYDIQFTTDSNELLLDYVTIVPVFYPGPERNDDTKDIGNVHVLRETVTRACEVKRENKEEDLCVQYSHVSVNKPGFVKADAEKEGFVYNRVLRRPVPTQAFTDNNILKQLDFSSLALLNRNQTNLEINKKIPKSGKYVVLLQYFTTHPTTQYMDFYLSPYNSAKSHARFHLPTCKFTFGCRTVGLTVQGEIRIYDLDEAVKYNLNAISVSHANIAVDSFIFVPLEKWSVNYIIPSKLCTTRKEVCTRTNYITPGDAINVEAEDFGDESAEKPPNIFDASARLAYLKEKDSFEKEVAIQTAGEYAIIIHYYQPYHATIETETAVRSDRTQLGKVNFKYCPNTSGCRTVVKNSGGGKMFTLGNKVTFSFKVPEDKKLWIDRILFVPKSSYSNALNEGEPVDRTNDFVELCSKDNLYVAKEDGTFCTKSVFSLTTFYNNGTLPCACNTRGSRSETCDTFGGQCPCFENIIGRACTRCKTGYYGFPNCRKCDCDFCDPNTGLCSCPPNTAGENCACIKGTYGYDPIQGCLPCDCDSSGISISAGLCNSDSGQCACLPSRTGRRCDQCKSGLFGYPNCQKCDCDERGSVGCDTNTGTCICKEHVAGEKCTICKIGHFYLNENNEKGCLDCWCSGQTNRCDSANASVLATLSDADDLFVNWNVTGVELEENGTTFYYGLSKTGDLSHLYGREMMLLLQKHASLLDAPIAIIKSKGEHIFYREKASENSTLRRSISLKQNLWEKSDGSLLTRAQFMKALAHAETIHVLSGGNDVDFTLQLLPLVDGGSQVEQCYCPDNTTGLSCQNCNNGFFRSGDFCLPCQCNGHSSRCDPKTGECYDCQHNTQGKKCEKCVAGYYGDPTSGLVDACKICACPNSSKNLATSCSRDENGIFNCACREGYAGQQCNVCADGYFGDPLSDEGCRPCQCNGNIDLSASGNCDPRTGECLRCVNNTSGERCEKCQPGYFGNGTLRNCKLCECNLCGSVSNVCDDVSGECTCKPGVTGADCNKCQPSTWGFDLCNGCQSCACSVASLDNDCDVITGRCKCKPGVTGLKCDVCEYGYHSYGKDGCKACNCPSGQACDINDGHCCEPDDPTCRYCPPYYIQTDNKCEYCGSCEERLFRRVDALLGNHSTVVNIGIATEDSKQQLTDIEIEYKNLTERVHEYNSSIIFLTNMVNGHSTEVKDIVSGSGTPPKTLEKSFEEKARNVLDDSMNIVDKAMEVHTSSNESKISSTKTRNDAEEIEKKLRELLDRIKVCPAPSSVCLQQQENVCFTDGDCPFGMKCCRLSICSTSTKQCKQTTIDSRRVLMEIQMGHNRTLEILREVSYILEVIEGRNYTELQKLVENELQLSKQALLNATRYKMDAFNVSNSVQDYDLKFNDLKSVLRHQINKTASSLDASDKAAKWNEKASKYNPNATIIRAQLKKEEADSKLKEVTAILDETREILDNIKFPNASVNSTILNKFIKILDERLKNLTSETSQLKILVQNASDYALHLKNFTEHLQSLLRDPNKYSEKARRAVRAYDEVVKAIEELLKLAKEAHKNSETALDLSEGLEFEAQISKKTSIDLNVEAVGQVKRVIYLSNWFNRLRELVKIIEENFNQATETLNEVNKRFPEFENATLRIENLAEVVETKAKNANKDLTDAKALVDGIKIPNFEELENATEEIMKLLDSIDDLIVESEAINRSISTDLEDVKLNHSLTEKEIDEEVVKRILRIRYKIERGRDGIKHYPSSAGIYNDDTSVELRIPDVAFRPSKQTRVKFYVSTQQDNALLLFMGSYREYFAFQVASSLLYIQYKVAGVSGNISTLLEVKIGAEDWRLVEFTKIGANINVTIDGGAPFTTTIKSSDFKLVKGESRLFVGKPPENFKIPEGVYNTTLNGGFESLSINGRRVGLYDALNYNTSVVPSQSVSKVRDDGDKYQFFGKQFLARSLPNRLRTNSKTKITTVQSNGLIMFFPIDRGVKPTKDFLSIDIVNGTLRLRLKLGEKDNLQYTERRYDDNVEHELAFKILPNKATLKIDDKDELEIEERAIGRKPAVGKRAYLGGYPQEYILSQAIDIPFFVGCMEESRLVPHWDTFGFERGCDSSLITSAVFSGGNSSLEISDPVKLSSDSQISSLFKSNGDGLLMNLESDDGGFLGIGIDNGKLKIDGKLGDDQFGNMGSRRRRSSDDRDIKDGEWYSFTVRVNNGKLEVLLNDEVIFSFELSSKAIAALETGFKLNFGGVQNKENSQSSLVRNSDAFYGEISDPIITNDGKTSAIDLTNTKEKTGVDFIAEPVPYYEQPVGVTLQIPDFTTDNPIFTTTPNGILFTKPFSEFSSRPFSAFSSSPITKSSKELSTDSYLSPSTEPSAMSSIEPSENLYSLPSTKLSSKFSITSSIISSAPQSTVPYKTPSIVSTAAPSTTSPMQSFLIPSTVASIAPLFTASSVVSSIAPFTSSSVVSSMAPFTSSSIVSSIAPSTSSSVVSSIAPSTSSSVVSSIAPSTSSSVVSSIAASTSSSVVSSIAPSTSSSVVSSIAPSTSSSVVSSIAPFTASSAVASITSSTVPVAPPDKEKPPTCPPEIEYADNTLAVTGNGFLQFKVTEQGFGSKGGLSFEFRTFSPDGMLMYSADKNQRDYISVFLEAGKVYFAFDTGSGDLIFTSGTDAVNDGSWKKVTIYRNKVQATLTVDGVTTRASGKPGPTVINQIVFLYFGGYVKEVKKSKISENSRLPISACFRNLEWSSGKKFPLKPSKPKKPIKCFRDILDEEKSVYFYGSGSYMVAEKRFFVGRKMKLRMDIKPFSSNGVLVSVTDEQLPRKGDFVILELFNGSVIARVQNGDGVIKVSFTPEKGATLCDKKWHRIDFSKLGTKVMLQVDQNPPVMARKGKKSVGNTKNQPLYVGGIPKSLKHSGIEVRESYQGCLKNVRIHTSKVMDLFKPVSKHGRISMFGCPVADSI